MHDRWCCKRNRLPHDDAATAGQKRWEYDTKGSRVITDLSTNLACGCLTSQIGRDVVFSTKYGRTQRRAHRADSVGAARASPRALKCPKHMKIEKKIENISYFASGATHRAQCTATGA